VESEQLIQAKIRFLREDVSFRTCYAGAMPIGVYAKVMGWSCSLLLMVLIYRGAVAGTLKKYPIFYIYTASILFTTIVGLSITWPNAQTYRFFYWTTEFTGLLLGVGVTWEIYMRAMAHYPGVRKVAWMLLAFIFTLVLVHSAAGGSAGAFSYVALARDMRTVQAVVLLTLFALLAYYAIPLGSNVRGIAIGYVFLVATSVLNLSLRSYFGPAFQRIWNYGGPLEFTASVGIWTAMLWSYHPEPEPPNRDMELDYEWLSGQAMRAMVRLRTHLIHPDGS
jgi:hypothetical protein